MIIPDNFVEEIQDEFRYNEELVDSGYTEKYLYFTVANINFCATTETFMRCPDYIFSKIISFFVDDDDDKSFNIDMNDIKIENGDIRDF